MSNVLEQTVERCLGLNPLQVDEKIEAIAIGGSVARHEQDPFSDLDLFVFLSESLDEPAMTSAVRSLATRLGHVVLFRGPRWIDGFGYSYSAMYEPLFVCQFNVNDRKTFGPHPMRTQGQITCFDKSGYFSSRMSESEEVPLDHARLFLDCFALFWFRAISVWSSVMRGQLWFAIEHLADMRDQMFVLIRLEARRPPPGLNFRLPSKSFENDFGGALASELAVSLSEYSAESVGRALTYAMNWFVEHAVAYARQEGLEFEEQATVAREIRGEIARRMGRPR